MGHKKCSLASMEKRTILEGFNFFYLHKTKDLLFATTQIMSKKCSDVSVRC